MRVVFDIMLLFSLCVYTCLKLSCCLAHIEAKAANPALGPVLHRLFYFENAALGITITDE